IGGILQRHNAEIDVAAIDLLENRGDAADPHVFNVLAEALDGSKMTVTIFRSKVGYLEHLLERPGAAHDFAENGADGGLIQGPFAGIEDVLKNFLFSCWGKDFRALIVLDFTDLGGQGSALVDEFQDL